MARKLFTLLVAGFFFYVASPLMIPVLMGVLFAVLFLPLQERMERAKIPNSLASFLLTFGVTLILIVPISVSLYLAAKLALQQLQALRSAPLAQGDWVKAVMESSGFQQALDQVREWYPTGGAQFSSTLEDLIRSVSSRAADLLGGLITHLPGMAMALLVLCLSMYFFMVDGRRLVMFFRHHSFFSPQQTNQLIETLEATCRSVLLASVVSGAFQAIVESFVAFLVGISSFGLVGAVVFMSSFIPVVGAAPVTFGLALQQYLIGRHWESLILLITAIFVGVMDNFIRPWFLRGSVNLHPLLAFVAAFGGLQTLGFAGVFLGPIVAGLFVVTLQILTQGKSS